MQRPIPRTLRALAPLLLLCGLLPDLRAQDTTPACRYPSADLIAQSPFNVYWTLWDPSVIWDEHNKLFRLVYTRFNPATQHMHVYGTESVDGVTWNRPIRDLLNPHMEGDGWGEGPMNNFETTSLVQIDATTFYLYFCGYAFANRIEKIGLAISRDRGVTYQMYANNPVLAPTQTWETVGNGIKEPSVIWDVDEGLFKCWYNVTGQYGTRVGYATSTDGIAWTKHASNPVLSGVSARTGWEWPYEVNHVNVVKDPYQGYHLFYANHFALGQAFSDDGVSWTRDPSPSPVIDYSYDSAYQIADGTWEFVDLEAYGSPAAIFKDDELWLFHMRTIPGAYKYGKPSKAAAAASPGYFGMLLGLAKGNCVFDTGKAKVLSVGEGYGSAASVPHMSVTNPVLGSFVDVYGTGAESGAVYAWVMVGLPSYGTDMPGGFQLYVTDPVVTIGCSVNATFGTWSLQYWLPNLPALVGYRVGVQSVVFGTSTPQGYSLTAGKHLTLGR